MSVLRLSKVLEIFAWMHCIVLVHQGQLDRAFFWLERGLLSSTELEPKIDRLFLKEKCLYLKEKC